LLRHGGEFRLKPIKIERADCYIMCPAHNCPPSMLQVLMLIPSLHRC
jgi:hypothetical protein